MATYQERIESIFNTIESKRRELQDLMPATHPDCQKHIHYSNGALLDAAGAIEKLLNQTPHVDLTKKIN